MPLSYHETNNIFVTKDLLLTTVASFVFLSELRDFKFETTSSRPIPYSYVNKPQLNGVARIMHCNISSDIGHSFKTPGKL